MSDETEVNAAAGAEPPKKRATLSMNPLQRAANATGATSALKPGLKLPPKPATISALRPGLKLPPKPGGTVGALRPGLKLPPKPGAFPTKPLAPAAKPAPAAEAKPAAVAEAKPAAPEAKPAAVAEAKPAAPEEKSVVAEAKPAAPEAKPQVPAAKPAAPAAALKPGLKLPTPTAFKPGLKLPTQTALKPGLKLPAKPIIRKPGATVVAAPLPKPVAVDMQGVGKLPTVGAETIARTDPVTVAAPARPPLEALKSATQKLKGVTQAIPQQAILHKTGIIADGAMSDAQKEAAKHKTARISLSDAMGVAPVKSEAMPMKTIRIKRPIDIAKSTSPQPPQPPPSGQAADESAKTIVVPPSASVVPAADSAAAAQDAKPAGGAAAPAATVTQRKTLKISRPGGGLIRPTGKFGLKKPAVAQKPAAASEAKPAEGGDAAGVADIPEIADIPNLPEGGAPVPQKAATVSDVPAWATTFSVLVQVAACGVIGALAWFLYENAQLPTFCGGLGWGA